MCSIIALGKENLFWLCAIGSEKQEFPWQVCLSSPPAVSFCTLGFSPCHSLHADLTWWACLANPSGGGRTGRGGGFLWVIKWKTGLVHTLPSSFSSPSLITEIACRKEDGACWWAVQSAMERMQLVLSGLTWISRSGRKKKKFDKSFNLHLREFHCLLLCLCSHPSLPPWWSVPASSSWLLLSAVWYTLFWALCVHLFSLNKSDIIYSHFQNVQLRFRDVRWSAQDHTAH